jgi:hypothetical protein
MKIQASLKSLIGLLIIISISLGWWISTRHNERLRSRQELLFKDWVQPLEVRDTRYMHCRALPQRNPSLNRWKVYLPHGRSYELQCVVSPDPKSTDEVGRRVVARLPIYPGESLFEVDWKRDDQRLPIVSIAVLGPTPDKSCSENVRLPSDVLEAFRNNYGCSQTYLGWEGTMSMNMVSNCEFANVLVPYGEVLTSDGTFTPSRGGFRIMIADVSNSNSLDATKRTAH